MLVYYRWSIQQLVNTPTTSGGIAQATNTEIPDHATFRGKEQTLGWLDKLGVCLSLALCNLANFDQL